MRPKDPQQERERGASVLAQLSLPISGISVSMKSTLSMEGVKYPNKIWEMILFFNFEQNLTPDQRGVSLLHLRHAGRAEPRESHVGL